MKLNRYIIVTEKGDLITPSLHNDKVGATILKDSYYENCFVVDAEISFELPLSEEQAEQLSKIVLP